ncbi:MAG: UbiD family decarboxylase, partial [Planctomycetaceae bacterium]|nr:UbiD family decarboxylase [Planctomycetaceae bacterium]
MNDLLRTKQLIVYDEPVGTYLEIAAVQRRLYERQAPAVLFTNVINGNTASGKRCQFPMLANLYGTQQRLEYIFRDGIEPLRLAMKVASELPPKFRLKEIPSLLKSLYYSRFKHVSTLRKPPVLQNRITLEQLPQLVSWQQDGGAYITLPQVYTEAGSSPLTSNLGMYRVQISGNEYIPNEECGLHYQIQRGIALHHAKAKQRGRPLPVKIFVGGAPCMTLAAVMPLPENVSEILFA